MNGGIPSLFGKCSSSATIGSGLRARNIAPSNRSYCKVSKASPSSTPAAHPTSDFYFSHPNKGSFVPLRSVGWPQTVQKGGIVDIKVDVDDNTSSGSVSRAIYQDKKYALFHGHLYNLKQLRTSVLKKLDLRTSEASVIHSKPPEEAFHILRQRRHLEENTINRLLISIGFGDPSNSILPKKSPESPSIFATEPFVSIPTTPAPSLALKLARKTFRQTPLIQPPSPISGAVLGLNHYFALKTAQSLQKNGIEIPQIGGKLFPAFQVFAPTGNSDYVNAFEYVLANSKILQSLPKKPKILDVGTGTGILSFVLLHAIRMNPALQKMSPQIFATDIHPSAVTCSLKNFQQLFEQEAKASQFTFQSSAADVYPDEPNFPQQFDLIISYPPYIPVSNIIAGREVGIYDKNGRTLHQLFFGAPSRLTANGKLVVVFRDLADINLKLQASNIESLAEKVGLEIESIHRAPAQPSEDESADISEKFVENSNINIYILHKKRG